MKVPIKAIERRYSPVALQWITAEYECVGIMIEHDGTLLALIQKPHCREWVSEYKDNASHSRFESCRVELRF